METPILRKFLKHLITCAERLLEQEEIDAYEVASLRRELMGLKKHISGKEPLPPEMLDKILGLELNVDEGLLHDGRKSRLFLAVRLLFHRNVLVQLEKERRLEKAKRQISDFRNSLDEIRFALELQGADRADGVV